MTSWSSCGWHGRSPHTQRAYRADSERFRAFVAESLAMITLGDLQAFADSLAGKPSSRSRTLAAVKSLLAFGQRTGYLALNVCDAPKLPAGKNTLAERILTETDVHRLLALEPDRRNQLLLRLLYIAGVRVSDIAALTWRDLQPRTEGGQVTVFGKGSKTRTVLLRAAAVPSARGARRTRVCFSSHRWPPAPVVDRTHRRQSRGARRARAGRLTTLAPPQPRHPRTRARRADPPGRHDPWPCFGRDYWQVPARPSDG
jgi:site-specific recombinase XerD